MTRETDIAQIIPAHTETAMFTAIMVMLIINLAAIVHFTNYEPECIPTIVTMEEAE